MSKKITFTILSISLLTVMAGAAVAPALGTIQKHFCTAPAILVRLIVSMPAIFIVTVNLLFPLIARHLRTRSIALLGLCLYVVSGMGAFLVPNIWVLLVLRVLLGVSVGIIMPLSTGLLAYYNPPEKMADLMGLSAAMNQLGGIVATLLAGYLATIRWNCSFLVYGLGLAAVVLVVLYLPNDRLEGANGAGKSMLNTIKQYHPCIVGIMLCMGLFFVFVSNFAITERSLFSVMQITYLMMGVDVVAFAVGLGFGFLMQKTPHTIKYIPPVAYMIAFALISFSDSIYMVLSALALIGIANGIGIPYMNTLASIKGGKDSVSNVMPIISASLYLGQFLSPLIVSMLSAPFSDDNQIVYKVAALFACIYLIQVCATRHFHKLPTRK